MMKRSWLACGAALMLTAPVLAAPNFFDNFENNVQGSVWSKWSAAANDNLMTTDTSHNHTPAGSKSARAWSSDPAFWTATADFGSTSGFVRAEVYVYEDKSEPGTDGSRPVTNMLALVGDTGGAPGFGTDYLQVGVVPFWPGQSTTYGWRSRYGDANQGGAQSVGIARKQGWTKLAIEADPGVGGQVRFYIDDVQVGTTQRMAANLRWVRIGNNSKTYENFWYDDVRVTPEPAALALVGLGAALLRRRRVVA